MPKLEPNASVGHTPGMSKVEQMESELQKLSPPELREIREWLDDILEDTLELKPDFEAALQKSEGEMAAGLRPRERRP